MSEMALQRIREAKEKKSTKLDLSKCELTHIPEEILELEFLEELQICDNKVQQFDILSNLKRLKILNAWNNEIFDASSIFTLKKLIGLGLTGNKIKSIEGIDNLANLQVLMLYGNKISDISAIKNLKNIGVLILDENNIENLDAIKFLPKLKRISLSYNKIRDLSPLLVHFKKKITISLKGNFIDSDGIFINQNPLEHPPISIVEQGTEAILTYFRNLEEQGEGKLNEAKLIIVGEPEAGKTSLMKKLLDPTYTIPQPELSTLGIQVREGWQFPLPDDIGTTFSANIWDFGGQEIQYMTHQFFLTAGAVYVLVSANDRKETTANFPYWFKAIHLFGEENGIYSPVLVVQNDKNGQFIPQFDATHYAQRYPELSISTRTVNLGKDDADFQALRAKIQTLLTQLPHVNDVRPARWNDIRTTLRKRAKKQHHINFAEYAAICQQQEVKDEASQLLLSSYLHRLGSLLHFVDDPTLHDFIILNPQWAVDAVYSVLNDNRIAQAGGYFTLETLENIWRDKYDMVERGKLLNLMKKDSFEVCYAVECKPNTYLAPQLLTEDRPPYKWNDNDTLKFRFQYKFMPEGIITRLIVRLNELLAKGDKGDLVWRNGMVLKKDGCRAQVQAEETREGLNIIDIAITGNPNQRKYLLYTIRIEVEKLHRKWFKNISVEQMIPCNCEVCTKPNNINPKYFEFSVLQRAQERGKKTVECDREFLDVPVSRLLEGVFERNEVNQLLNRREMMTGTNISGITLGDGAQLIIGKDNTQKANSDNLTITITADQRQIISTVLDEMLEHKLPKDITKAVVKMQDVVEADAEKPTEKTQSLLSRFIEGVKQIAGFTNDANKIGEFVAKHQDDIGAVLTSIQSSL
jgi:hypothetical protein